MPNRIQDYDFKRDHRILIAGYYDAQPERIRDWLDAAKLVKGVIGVMYTTWENKYEDLERFLKIMKKQR